ncbi:MAG: DUF2201 family putative metallopeptidase [Planctomycetaceae bacterium]
MSDSESTTPESSAATESDTTPESDSPALPPVSRLLEKAMQALRFAILNLPHLSGLAQNVRLLIDRRVETAAVTPSGRILFHPEFLHSLTLPEAAFVMAHELYHLVLQTHERETGSDAELVNIAHDLIINDILETELGQPPPAGGLRRRGASHVSLERLLVELKKNPNSLPSQFWRKGRNPKRNLTPMERAMADAGLNGEAGSSPQDKSEANDESGREPGASRSTKSSGRSRRGDALTRSQELELFPLDDPQDLQRKIELCLEVSIQSVALSALSHSWEHDASREDETDRLDRVATSVEMLRETYRTPWQRVVQQWLDSQIPMPRSYARPSRRAGDRTDVALPGRNRESWIVHVVLDTSGSMWPHLPRALGALASCCAAAGVDLVHVVQCDAGITVDEVIPIEELGSYRVKGFTGWEGQAIRRALEPPPPPPPPPRPKPSPPPPEPPPPEPEPIASEPSRRRNRVVSRRVASVSVSAGHRPHLPRARRVHRRKLRGQFVGIKIKRRPDVSMPQELHLSVDSPNQRLSLRTAPDSNLSPALRQLARQPEVEAVLVLTDGEIEYPAEPMPYEVLWILTQAAKPGQDFAPDYGQVLHLEGSP